jgi:hypothetical protein
MAGTLAANHELVAATDIDDKVVSDANRKIIARERTLAIALIRSADKSKYRALITGLANQYAMDCDEYPTDVLAVQNLFVHYKTPVNTGG